VPHFVEFPIEGTFAHILGTDEVVVHEESWKTCPKDNPTDEASAQIWRDLDFSMPCRWPCAMPGASSARSTSIFTGCRTLAPSQLAPVPGRGRLAGRGRGNILANEEILEREREKALLLSLSEDMASIRDRQDLWRVMMEKVQQLLPHDESPQVFVLDETTNTMRALLIAPSDEAERTVEYQAHMAPGTAFSYRGTPFEEALAARTPQVFSYAYFQQHYPDYWGTRIWAQVGIAEMLAVQLSYAGTTMGMFGLLSRSPQAFRRRNSTCSKLLPTR
jgi:hypothetical protein